MRRTLVGCAAATVGVVATCSVGGRLPDGTAGPSPATPASSAARPPASHADTFTVTADTVPGPRGAWTLGLPKPLADTAARPGMDCPALFRWARQHGAVSTQMARHAVKVTASRKTTLEVISVRGHITKEAPSQTAVADISCQPLPTRDAPEAGPAPPWDQAPTWDEEPDVELGTEERTTLLAEAGHRVIGPGTAVVWQFDVQRFGSSDTHYLLDLEYLRDGVPIRITLTDHGRPFFLAARNDGMGYSPPAYTFVRTPQPHFAFRPAQCIPMPCP